MRKQPGHSLIECVTAISLMGIIFTTIAIAMSGLCRSNQRVRDHVAVELDMERFAAQFRADAHQARAVQEMSAERPDPQRPSIVLSLSGDRSIQYVLKPGRIERLLYQAEVQLHQETYRLPEPAKTSWRLDRERSTPIVSLIIEQPAGGESSQRSDFQTSQIDVAVGLLQPLLGSDSS